MRIQPNDGGARFVPRDIGDQRPVGRQPPGLPGARRRQPVAGRPRRDARAAARGLDRGDRRRQPEDQAEGPGPGRGPNRWLRPPHRRRRDADVVDPGSVPPLPSVRCVVRGAVAVRHLEADHARVRRVAAPPPPSSAWPPCGRCAPIPSSPAMHASSCRSPTTVRTPRCRRVTSTTSCRRRCCAPRCTELCSLPACRVWSTTRSLTRSSVRWVSH
jgi:hypothetical protein